MFAIGQVINKKNYTKAILWCNKNDAKIDIIDGKYIISEKPAPAEPTLAEKVAALEQTYGMTRWQREGILAEGSLYSEYTKAKAQEIEDLAAELRADPVVEEPVAEATND